MNVRHLVADSYIGRLLRGVARRRAPDGSVTILIYHDVPCALQAAFGAQIRFVHDTFGFMTPADLERMMTDRVPPTGRKVLLTFDDGFKSNAVIAKSVLDPLGIKAIFFIPSGFTSASSREDETTFIRDNIYNGGLAKSAIPDAMAPMEWADLQRLVEHGHTIGAHTVNHRNLAELEDEGDLVHEIIESGETLQTRLGIAIEHFAFPFGGITTINRRALAIIRQRYKYCHSGVRGVNTAQTDPYVLLRDPVSPCDPPAYFRFIIENGLELMYRRRARMLAQHERASR